MIESAYIHIPFCIRKCKYCSFVSGEDIKNKEQYLDALLTEISGKYKDEKLKTIYIGGGTPSLLEPCDIKNILSCFKYTKETEITLEANPETVTESKIKEFKNLGINRISIGVQTFNDKLLQLIGRKHTKENILNSIEHIKSAGFTNYSLDLIYGLPLQTVDMFIEDIKEALKTEPKHISSYGLKIEEGSFFYNNKPKSLPDDEEQAKMYLKLCEILKDNGFNHYEISNFAKNGFESRHNQVYWHNKEYYGFGLNASGYENNIRYRNKSNLKEYLQNPLIPEEQNVLTEQETRENEIFLALRLAEGLDIKEFNNKYKTDFLNDYGDIIKKYLEMKLLEYTKDSLKLTENGFLLSNEIMSEFIET